MKIRELLKNGIDELNKNNVDEPVLKAKMLLTYLLSVRQEDLIIKLENEVSEEIINKFDEKISELVNGKPIQYITNQQEFYGIDFYVDENVLIPQPDTEILVEEVINIAKNIENKPQILDMCTGSGAIAVSLGKNIDAEVFASDISIKALEIARRNAQTNDVNVEILQSDMFENIEGKYDIIVSNPPYIETETIKTLSCEVQNEPIIALDGGKDGLEFYRILADKARFHLKTGGILIVEIGYNQKEAVEQIFKAQGFTDIYSKKDFGANDRIVAGKWR